MTFWLDHWWAMLVPAILVYLAIGVGLARIADAVDRLVFRIRDAEDRQDAARIMVGLWPLVVPFGLLMVAARGIERLMKLGLGPITKDPKPAVTPAPLHKDPEPPKPPAVLTEKEKAAAKHAYLPRLFGGPS